MEKITYSQARRVRHCVLVARSKEADATTIMWHLDQVSDHREAVQTIDYLCFEADDCYKLAMVNLLETLLG